MLLRFLLVAIFCVIPAFSASADDKVDFSRDIRPILSNNCFKCHGPALQRAKLRLDDRQTAIDRGAIAPGKHAESELYRRVMLDNDNKQRMPPVGTGERLTPDQISKLKAWIDEGANYSPHWAFTVPKRPKLPGNKQAHPIDAFIIDRLRTQGLTPSPRAGRTTLLRRVTLDLTGLLPTLDELDAFLKDDSPLAYEKVVDRLLASQHYGERQARHWLDLARYADSSGYTVDGPRQIWAYRDWVINAFNDEMPFDQFTIEQLAGDLLPDATFSQRVATGFHRNTPFNEEGGSDPEQFRVERTIDRVNTTAAVWLGLTAACAQCHDHKYDPISQKEYYQIYAFFNSCDEASLSLRPSPEMEKQMAQLQAKLAVSRLTGDTEETKKHFAELKKLQNQVPTTMIMRERQAPRKTFIQIRGDFLRKGIEVQPGYPAAIDSSIPAGRLTRHHLAAWLVHESNPLTARVTVNREWQKFFGRGIVETENDFGYQGSYPTHPELLDWLAVEFREKGWSIKKLHKLIVTSETYKQSSVMRKDLAERDPRNLLLGRQTRLRLEAEIIRDVALCASGTLNPKIGGRGVFPPQPQEVFAFTQSSHSWKESTGPDRYRRGMYTYIWRQSQHPLLTTFDGADAQTTCTKRNRSNTPLQALHLANDTAFVELANALGTRIEAEGPEDDAGRIRFAFRICFTREPSKVESDRVREYLAARRKLDPKTAWSAVARLLMNLDEFITRE